MFRTGTDVERGCNNKLGLDDYVSCTITANETCHSCIGNQCNIKLDPQSCYSCNSTIDEHCASSPYLLEPKYCHNYYEKCFTAIRNTSVYRGCVDTDFADDQICSDPITDCQKCSGDNCNRESVQPHQCFVCNSSIDPNCASNPNDTMLVQCDASVKSGCYHSINGTGLSIM